MCRKVVLLISIVLVLGLVNGASAANITWDGGAPDNNSWCAPENWNPTGVPGPLDTAIAKTPYRGPVIDCDVNVGTIQGPAWNISGSQVMDIISGTVFVGEWERDEDGTGTAIINISGSPDITIDGVWRTSDSGTGIINISGDPNIIVDGTWRGADSPGGLFKINMSGGRVEVGEQLIIGDDGGGEINISGGSIIITAWMDLGGPYDRPSSTDPITINMTGGLISVGTELKAPGNAARDGVVTINLDGGTIDCGAFSHADANYAMDINEGMFIIDGDVRDAINADISAGWITAYNDDPYANVVVEYTSGKTIVTAEIWTEKAWHESPRNGAENECPDADLSWDPGLYATSHDVYFGTDFDNVNDATDPNVLPGRGRQVTTSYNPPGPLELGQTYYWRIDEANDPCLWKGDVWQFTINDGKAYSPSPGDGSWSVPANKVFSWTPGCLAADVDGHDVYFGIDFNDVNDATDPYTPPGRGRQTGTSYDPPGDLDADTTYYWRIDEVNDSGIAQWRGNVWSFTTFSLLVHYKFDETEGDIAHDSSGHGFDGYMDGPEEGWDPDGHDAGCLVFDDDGHVLVPQGVLSDVGEEITITAWLNSGTAEPGTNVVFETGGGDFFLNATVPDVNGDAYWRAGDDSCDVLSWTEGNPTDWVDSWNHFAFVKDENAGKMSIYFNGLLADEKTDVSAGTLAGVRNKTFKIGAKTGHHSEYEGKIDEFRVYDYALSEKEIAAVYYGRTDLGIAWLPSPHSRAKDVPRDVVLSWLPGDYAISHEVYFGTNFDNVNDANDPNVLPGRGRQDPCSYDPPGLLELGTNYYWRIDEVDDPCMWKGDVWRFTVANFLILDNMEDYNDIKPDRIYDTWHDWSQYDPVGGKYPTSAELTLETADANVHGGKQSMKFQYNNSDSGAWMFYRNISEIDANTIGPLMYLEIGQDWTILDIKVLTLHFIGHPDNDANEQMYVALADSAGRTAVVPYGYYTIDEDMNDIKKREWTEWNILLEDFNDINGVNLADVNDVYIGFGNRDNPTVGGSGVVFFDDIRLHPRKCIPTRRKPDLDLSDNCIVDIEDIEIIADDWLEHDANIATAAPDACAAHYKFDGNVDDFSGNNHHGTVIEGTAIYTGGKYNDCLNFNESYGVQIPNGVFSDVNEAITISVWVNGNANQDDASNVIFEAGVGAPPWQNNWNDTVRIRTDWIDSELEFEVGYPEEEGKEWNDMRLEDWAGQWNHYAFVADTNSDFMGIYHNGRLVTDGTTDDGMAGITHGFIGIAPDDDDGGYHDEYTGKLDDFRIYDYALSQAEIAYIVSDGAEYLYIPLVSPGNIYDVAEEVEGKYLQAVNFRDYAKLVDNWLEEKLWPPE